MFNVMKENCPYQNWTSVARERCPNPLNFHCLKDEFGRIGWVCREPIWVEHDRCPVFNVGAKKLDSTSCSQTRCPPYSYRSNDVDVEYACRYIMNKESSTTPFTTKETETNKNNIGIIVAMTVLTLVAIIVFVAGIVIYKRRQQSSKNNGKRQEESKDLMEKTDTETPNAVKTPTNVFHKAKNCLIQKRMVVITGVQGSGKTFLAKSLVNDLQKDGNKMNSVWICKLDQLQQVPSENVDIFILEELFDELQLYDKFKETLTALNTFLGNVEKAYLIITIPSFTWTEHGYEFDGKFDKVLVDLDRREESEKLTILEYLKEKNKVPSKVSEKLNELQNELLVTSVDDIGFPALVSWMCKQQNLEIIEKCLCCPLQTIKDEISSIRNAKTAEDRGKFLVLAYMCLKGGTINIRDVDISYFYYLKKKYAPKFEDRDLAKYCDGMVGYYLLTYQDGCYEIDLNIIKKIVCDSLAEDGTCVDENYRNNYVTEEITSCPVDDNAYIEILTMM